MKRATKTLRVCECGFPITNRNRRLHRFSVYHREHRRIKALLSDNRISYAEIGNKVGLTRERIRQIDRQLGGALGRERVRQRVADDRLAAWRQREGHRQVIAKCEELGYKVEPSRRGSGSRWLFEAGFVVINGWRTHIAPMSFRGRYLALKRASVRADFCVRISPIGFFVFPSKVWKTLPKATEFSPNGSGGKRGVTNRARHDYLNYFEAWKLLKAKKRG